MQDLLQADDGRRAVACVVAEFGDEMRSPLGPGKLTWERGRGSVADVVR